MRGWWCLGLSGVVACANPEPEPQPSPEDCVSILDEDFEGFGDEELDAFFAAVSLLGGSSDGAQADIQEDLLALAETYGLASGEIDVDYLDALRETLHADFDAYTTGVTFTIDPAECTVNVGCTAPSVAADYAFQPGVDPADQAAFDARVGELETRGAAVLDAFNGIELATTGKLDGEVVFDPSPVLSITDLLDAFVAKANDDRLDIPGELLPCLIPAFDEAMQILTDTSTSSATSLELRAPFEAIFSP